MSRFAGWTLLAILVGACTPSSGRQAPATLTPTPVFGPVIRTEVIAGRADADDEVMLLAGGMDLIRIEPTARRWWRTRLTLAPGESCWGLARLSNGRLWTLKGRRALLSVNPDGSVGETVDLRLPHFGIFAAGDRLVYQEAIFTPPAPALVEAEPDGARRAWSGIMTRPFEGLARASAAVLNMLSCGASRGGERACWFPDESAVYLVDSSGHTRRVALISLPVVPPETLLTSDNPARPVRDAYVTDTGDIWVLSTGRAPSGGEATPGGWLMAHFGPSGEPLGQSRLTDAARLILGVQRDRVTLLLASGMVGEVSKW